MKIDLYFWSAISGHKIWILRNERLRMLLFNESISFTPIDKFTVDTYAHLRPFKISKSTALKKV